MNDSVTVFAPVSIGNVSVGFDSLGLALKPIDGDLLGDSVTIEALKDGEDNAFELTGTFADRLPKDKESNIVWHVLHAFERHLEQLNVATQKVRISLHKNIPVCSGLGSSACSVVAAFDALNQFYQSPIDQSTLLRLMGESEAEISGSLHYDNVAPCYLGGLQLMLHGQTKVTQSIPVFENVYWVLAYPDVLVSTQAARDLLPKHYDRATLIRFGQNLAGFVAASYEQNLALAFSLITDEVAEPYRAGLLPDYLNTQAQLKRMNSLAVGISGSGPTIFSACVHLAEAQEQATWLRENYLQSEHGFVTICQVDQQGSRIIKQGI
ncbi:homoserine kinase [Marinicella litoralis]|uniref:Homoserine kinase n=1 Tax=Marinicella litoralis TaxID=644220 RepID=A0A4R6XTZ3_9GAMM|nr:homoserine kinase [Marinicella litoralis]TDR23442.1 homoserine kinase [Marinicella litoralis]